MIHGARLRALLALLVAASFLALHSSALAQATQPTFRRLMQEGQRFRSVGNIRAASAKYNAAVRAAATDEELAQALIAHAVAQRNLGREEPAEADLRRAIELDISGPFRRAAMFQLAALLEEHDRLDEAIDLYREVAGRLKEKPAEAGDALLAAARLLTDEGRYEEAGEVLGAVRLDVLPRHLKADAMALKVEVLIGLGDVRGASKAIADAGLDPSEASHLYVRLARVLFDDDRPDEALKACETAIEAEPQNQSAWRAQYEIAAEHGTLDKLKPDLADRLEAEPNNTVLLERMAAFAEWDRDPDKALEVFRRLVALRPDDSTILERAGSVASEAGRNEEALDLYRAALKLTPEDTGIYYMMGEVYAKLGDKAQAMEMLKKGIAFRAADPDSARRLGMLLVRNSLYDEAAAVYQEFRRSIGDPNALAYEMAGALSPVRPEDALGEYVRAASVSLDDADAVAPQALKLARETDLLPRLRELTEDAFEVAGQPGLALLLTMAHAAQGGADAAVKRAVELGLGPDELIVIGESLEFEGDRDAAAQVYAAVATHPDASPGLRLELGLRSAEAHVAAGRAAEAEAILRATMTDADGPPSLRDRARFLLADLTLASGGDLTQARGAFAELADRGTQPDLQRRARWRLADCAFAAGEFDEAEALYGELGSQTPAVPVLMPPLPPGFDLRRRAGVLPPLLMMGIHQQDPRMTPAYAATRVAECAFRRGNLDRAKALFAEVAEKYPDSVYANDAVGRRLFVVTHFSRPRPASENYLAALAAGSTDHWEEALEQLRGIAEMGISEPLADDAALLTATLLEAHGQISEAAQAFRELPAAFSGSLLAPEALLNAARLARSLDDDRQAKEDLTAILRNFPAAPMAKVAGLWLDDLQHGRPWTTLRP